MATRTVMLVVAIWTLDWHTHGYAKNCYAYCVYYYSLMSPMMTLWCLNKTKHKTHNKHKLKEATIGINVGIFTSISLGIIISILILPN